jgi:Bacterial PH domain
VSQKPDIIPHGLPDHLPDGERLIWQGKPNWKHLAVNAFQVRKVAIYFGAIILGQGVYKLLHGATPLEAAQSIPIIAALGLIACSMLLALAYASAKTSHYTLTNKRCLMKVGLALPVIINVPFRQVDGVAFATTSGTSGNICFKTAGETRLAYLMLWPHCKPWYMAKPQPAFRDIPDVEVVAQKLAFTLGGQMPIAETSNPAPNYNMIPAE